MLDETLSALEQWYYEHGDHGGDYSHEKFVKWFNALTPYDRATHLATSEVKKG